MAKYADITPFYEWLDNLEELDNSRYADRQTLMLYEVRDELDSLPEVVQCVECKYYRESENPEMQGIKFCYRLKDRNGEHIGYNYSDDDFCSYGEREDNG